MKKVAINQMVEELEKTIQNWTERGVAVEYVDELKWIKWNAEKWVESITFQTNEKRYSPPK
jgi:hypothetical protein